jgi:hypothetical protein
MYNGPNARIHTWRRNVRSYFVSLSCEATKIPMAIESVKKVTESRNVSSIERT